jgi:hypothetical protein
VKLWEELRLDRFWVERLLASRKGTRWDQVLLVLTAYRLIALGAEWRLHREWYGRSDLADPLGADAGLTDSHTLYRCYHRLLEHKRARSITWWDAGGICSTRLLSCCSMT